MNNNNTSLYTHSQQSYRFRHMLYKLPPQQITSVLLREFFCRISRVYDTLLAHLYLWRWGVKGRTQLTVNGSIRCNNYGTIIFGKYIVINSGPNRNFVGADNKTSFWVGKGASLKIGNNVKLSGTTIISFTRITIEDDTFIGGNCAIYDTDFHTINSDDRIKGFGEIESKPVCIGSKAFIGAHSIILKGVSIGNSSIIGAGSVVTKDVPPQTIWAGNPARYIKDNK